MSLYLGHVGRARWVLSCKSKKTQVTLSCYSCRLAHLFYKKLDFIHMSMSPLYKNVREELRCVDELKTGDLVRSSSAVGGFNILLSAIRYGTSSFKLVTFENGEIRTRACYSAKSELWVLVYLET